MLIEKMADPQNTKVYKKFNYTHSTPNDHVLYAKINFNVEKRILIFFEKNIFLKIGKIEKSEKRPFLAKIEKNRNFSKKSKKVKKVFFGQN